VKSISCISCLLLLFMAVSDGRAEFPAAAEALLDEITFASFQFFWRQADSHSGLVRDKSGKDVCSVASLGFGLAVLPIGVERGYVSFEAAEKRAISALKTLQNSNAQHNGVFCHFIDLKTGDTTELGYESIASSVDTALMIAGAIVVGEYFGGEVKQLAGEISAKVNWASFVNPQNGQVYMAWQADDPNNMAGAGNFDKQTWDWYTDETILISLLGQASPREEYRLKPETMTNFNRPIGTYKAGKPYIYTYPGALFTYMFAHCFYDFKKTGKDSLGIDWFENTRRAVIANRDWCRDNSGKFATYGQNLWGITAGSAPDDRYVVLGNPPRGASDNQGEYGTLHAYGAGMSIPFVPNDAIAALRYMRNLKIDNKPVRYKNS